MTEHCECGGHNDGPVTTAQRERIQLCFRLVDDWLEAVLSGGDHRESAAAAPLKSFIKLAPTLHDAHVRLVGLCLVAARRCGEATRRLGCAPAVFDVDSGFVDQIPPFVRLSMRLVIAYSRRDDDAANDLVIAYLRQLECGEIQQEMARVFAYLSQMYLWIDDVMSQEQQRRRATRLRTLACRLTSAWRRGGH